MSNTTDGIHTTTNPQGTGWVNQGNGVVLTRHKTKVKAIGSGRLLAKRHRVHDSPPRRQRHPDAVVRAGPDRVTLLSP
jgi:hypothetical protein